LTYGTSRQRWQRPPMASKTPQQSYPRPEHSYKTNGDKNDINKMGSEGTDRSSVLTISLTMCIRLRPTDSASVSVHNSCCEQRPCLKLKHPPSGRSSGTTGRPLGSTHSHREHRSQLHVQFSLPRRNPAVPDVGIREGATRRVAPVNNQLRKADCNVIKATHVGVWTSCGWERKPPCVGQP
jgi:hypothetical protein